MFAQHHKEHLRVDKSIEEDDHSLMAMSRSTSQASDLGNRTGGEEDEDELPEQDPLAERFLPKLPGEAEHFLKLVQLERQRGETSRALLSYAILHPCSSTMLMQSGLYAE